MILHHPPTYKLNMKFTTSHIPQNSMGGKKRNKSHLSGQEGRSRWQTDAQKHWRILKLWKAHGIKSTRQKKNKRLEKNRTQFWRRLLWRWTVTRNLQDGRQSEMALSCDAVAHWIWSNLLIVSRILSSWANYLEWIHYKHHWLHLNKKPRAHLWQEERCSLNYIQLTPVNTFSFLSTGSMKIQNSERHSDFPFPFPGSKGKRYELFHRVVCVIFFPLETYLDKQWGHSLWGIIVSWHTVNHSDGINQILYTSHHGNLKIETH